MTFTASDRTIAGAVLDDPFDINDVGKIVLFRMSGLDYDGLIQTFVSDSSVVLFPDPDLPTSDGTITDFFVVGFPVVPPPPPVPAPRLTIESGGLMRVVLYKLGSATPETDVTAKLLNEEQEITQELERQAFERTFDDVTLHFSNLRDYFTLLFSDTTPTTKWQVTIYSDTGRRIFKGFMDNETLEFLPGDKTVELTAFQANKIFWERAKTTRVPITIFGNNFNWQGTQVTLTRAINDSIYNMGLQVDLFDGVDLGEYAERPIRAFGNDDLTGNNEGRWKELLPATTIEELLRACQYYYNAEFFIDPETDMFTMRRRGAVLNDAQLDIGPTLLRKPDPPRAIWLDDERIDWLYTYSLLTHPVPSFLFATPIGGPIGYTGLTEGTHQYILTSVYGSDDIERFASLPISVTLPGPPQGFDGWNVVLSIPPAFGGATERRLYRKDPGDQQQLFREVTGAGTRIMNNDQVEFIDNIGIIVLAQLPILTDNIANRANQWVRFDEATGVWVTPIVDVGQGLLLPAGRVLQAVPELRFTVIGDPLTELAADPFQVFCFFGKDNDPDGPEFQAQWEPMFRSRRRLIFGQKRTDLRVGDSITYATVVQLPDDWTPNATAVVRKVGVRLKSKESLVEAVTV